MSRLVVLSFAVCGIALALAGTAVAKGRVDRSFGDAGVVDLAAGVERGSLLGTFAVAPGGGGIFFTEERSVCPRGGCPYEIYLKRYVPNGAPDRGFGGGGRALITSESRYGGAAIAIDASGRPLVAWEQNDRGIVIRRLRRDGTPDSSFGHGGTVALPCAGCYLGSLELTPAGGVLAAAYSEPRPYRGDRWFFARLRADGSRDAHFGGDGIVRMPMWGYGPASAAPAPRGSTVLFGNYCCRESSTPFIDRLSPAGRLDRRFSARTKRSFRGAPGEREDEFSWSGMSLIQRRDGGVLLFGTSYQSGVAIALNRNGSRDRSFAQDGLRGFSLNSIDAAPDGSDGAYVIGSGRRGFRLIHLRPDGSLDPGFGRLAVPAYNEEGLELAAQGRGRVIVFGRGFSFCRQACGPPEPKMLRVVG